MKESFYRDYISSPPASARGFTRWWWYGCCVEKDEIDRELDFMHEAGIGGVELQILYPVEADDPEKGFRNIPFGSPEFFDILKYTSEACEKRGMKLDITPGSSWPYGGPFIDDEDAQQEAIPYQYDITGPCDFSCDFTTRFAGDVCAAVMGRMEHSKMLPQTVIDITDKFVVKPLFGWPWGTELKTIHIPEGDWKLCFFVISMHRNRVGKPGRNAEGRVIDHCSRHAMDTFLKNMVEPIAERVPGINTWFCDSIEVEGHNWSGVLLDEFRKRRGYDLRPYIYALWGDLGDISPLVRYDYFKTMGELTIENFFDVLTDFAHSHGQKSRIQAHGTWGDILRVYAAADIPEGETFGDHRTLEVNTIHRRLASSASHIYGREICSNETFTWLKRPRFTETLEEMKAAVDAVFCDGMNMIVNHGYAYSPEKAGKRGWPFYASTHINHTVPWWSLYHNLAGYITRVSAMLRRGHNVSETAVYLPTADVYSDNMMSELHLAMRMEEHLGRKRMDRIQKSGYWFDYINDEALTSLGEIKDGGLRIGENVYRTIILAKCTRLPVETAEALKRFAEAGGILIAAEKAPDRCCGLVGYEENTAKVRSLISEAFSLPNAYITDDADDSLISCLRAHAQPDVMISYPDDIGFVHRADGNDHIYFISNISNAAHTADAVFKGRREECRIFRSVPDDGGEYSDIGFSRTDSDIGASLSFELEPHESVFVVFSPDFTPSETCRTAKANLDEEEITGWSLDIPERGVSFGIGDPVSWENLPGLGDYSGEGIYSAVFFISEEDNDAVLTLEGLSCACSVYINGSYAGDIWTHPYRLKIGKYLTSGLNTVEISVKSTLVNEMRVLDPDGWHHHDTVLEHWPYYGKIIDDHLKVRMNTRREHDEQTEPVKSGIWGRVRIITK